MENMEKKINRITFVFLHIVKQQLKMTKTFKRDQFDGEMDENRNSLHGSKSEIFR